MANRKSQGQWKIGDVFVIPTDDGHFVLSQIVGREASVLNSVSVALFDYRLDSVSAATNASTIDSMNMNAIFSVLFTTRDLLDSGSWKVVGHRDLVLPKGLQPYEPLRKSGFVGAKVIGSGIVNRFVNAFYALSPWDNWKDPAYLDHLLISPSKKPIKLVYKGL
jgi:hypothetical protein